MSMNEYERKKLTPVSKETHCDHSVSPYGSQYLFTIFLFL